jgi:hypothetical protein
MSIRGRVMPRIFLTHPLAVHTGLTPRPSTPTVLRGWCACAQIDWGDGR